MYSLPEPVDLYRSAVPVAIAAIAWAALSCFFMPGAPILQLAVVVLAGGAFQWVWNLKKDEETRLAELSKLRFFKVKELPKKPGHFYLGKGFYWQRRHSQSLYDLYGEDADSRPVHPEAKGDLSIFGVGGLEAEDFWYPEGDNNQHVCVLGSTGFGKTFLAQLFVDQAIDTGAGCIIVDPKPDKDLLARAKKAAEREGKTFRLFDMTNPETSATYNPLARSSDAAQLGARYAAACGEATGDAKFFIERAAATGQTVANAMKMAKAYLEAIGGSGDTAPPILQSLRARTELIDEKQKEPSSEDVAQRMRDVKLPGQFTPNGWTPRLTAATVWGVERPHQLLAWLVHILHFAAIGGPLDAAALKTRDDVKDIWELHKETWSEHPLAAGAKGIEAEMMRLEVKNLDAARLAAERLNAALADIHEFATHSEDHWARVNSSLPAALTRFRGPRQRIVEAVAPDIDWEKVFEGKEVVYFALGAMVDRVGAEGFARVIIEDLVAYVGERQVARKPKCPTYFICDEIYSFVTPSYIDLLNKSRSAGMRCIGIGQTQADYRTKLGPHGTDQVMGNFNTVIQLRSPEGDAKAFGIRAGQTKIMQTARTVGSSAATANDQSAGTSQLAGFGASDSAQYSGASQSLVPEDAVRRLPIGQAFISGMGFVGVVAFPIIDD